jgi:hypothetical protein
MPAPSSIRVCPGQFPQLVRSQSNAFQPICPIRLQTRVSCLGGRTRKNNNSLNPVIQFGNKLKRARGRLNRNLFPQQYSKRVI